MFIREELAPGIVSYTNVLESPKDFINDLEGIVHLKGLTWTPATQNSGDTDEREITPTVRDCSVISLPPFDRSPEMRQTGGAAVMVHDFLNEFLLPVVNDYRNMHSAFHWVDSEGWQILKYGQNNHFVNHYDDSKVFPRTVSMSYYLNEDYEGGEIEFPRFNLKIKPKENQMVMFPSNYVYNHSVHPVVSGTRYAVVGWWN